METMLIRVSTNLTEQICRRFQEKISIKIQDMFALLRPAMQCTESTTFSGACDDELQPTNKNMTCTTWGHGKDKKGDQFLK